MRIDIRSMARRAGVSTATISLALNNDPRVAAATRERIIRLAARLNYTPSHLGRALQSSRSYLAGYLLADLATSFYSTIAQSAGEIFATAGYGLLMAICNTAEQETRQLQLFRDKRVDGLLVSGFSPQSRAALLALRAAGTPLVACSLPSFAPGVPSIIIDNRAGGQLAAEHLIGLGHRRLGYCFAAASLPERLAGFIKTVSQHDLPAPTVCRTEAELNRLLTSTRRPSGIVAFSDFDAIRVKHVAQRAGLTVPGDLSLVGFDDFWYSGLPEFGFTTIAQPKEEIGRRAARMLLDLVHGHRVENVIFAPRLVVRTSTAPLPQK